ncbi:MAG: acyl-CoA carboxylase subunit beta [Acidobacteriota bacterium]
MSKTQSVTELQQKRQRLQQGGGDERIKKQHAAEKLTARERLELMLDRDSFQEVGLFAQHRATLFGMAGQELPADGVVTGTGRVDGRVIQVASQDFTVAGGSAGEVHCDKIADMQRISLKTGTPFVFINDSGGARIQEGVVSLAGYARVFYNNVILSGVVPQISLICGPCAGGAAYSPALADFIIQTKYAQMFITGPSVIKQVTGEVVTADELGGPFAQMSYSGVVHFVAENDVHAIQICKRLLSFLPANNVEDPPRGPNHEVALPDEALNTVVPEQPKASYDMHEVILRVVDRQDFLEVQEEFAANMIIGFGRITGRTVGIVANQPAVLAGAVDINASDKTARFIRFCNAFNIPLVTFVDVPGFLPGVEQEYGGIIRHGAKILFAYSAATVPKITVVVRKAYGGGYIAMCAKDLGADRVVAWPSAEIAVMGAESAAEVVFKREINAAPDKAAKKAEVVAQYRNTFSTPYVSAARRLVDDIIEPAQTRPYLAAALDALQSKRDWRPQKKHGLIPL